VIKLTRCSIAEAYRSRSGQILRSADRRHPSCRRTLPRYRSESLRLISRNGTGYADRTSAGTILSTHIKARGSHRSRELHDQEDPVCLTRRQGTAVSRKVFFLLSGTARASSQGLLTAVTDRGAHEYTTSYD
jgi:hypothetical protein